MGDGDTAMDVDDSNVQPGSALPPGQLPGVEPPQPDEEEDSDYAEDGSLIIHDFPVSNHADHKINSCCVEGDCVSG